MILIISWHIVKINFTYDNCHVYATPNYLVLYGEINVLLTDLPMMKILVPTDFSKLSVIAVRYAVQLAKKVHAEIILLNVVYIDAPPRAQSVLNANRILDAITDCSKNEFICLINEIKRDEGTKLKIDYKIVKGHPVEDVIETFARHNNIDLIIMGTKGASGLKKVLVGSNATAVIGNSSIPVISVPEHARFKGIKDVVYASDLLAADKEVKALIPYAKLFNASIHLLHVIPPSTNKKIDLEKIKNDLISKNNYPRISVHIILNDDINEAIDEYLADSKADMLAMFTHEPTFFERLFGKSVTREMAFQNWIPLFAFKK